MRKIVWLAAATATLLSAGGDIGMAPHRVHNDLYTDTYLYYSGVVEPHIDTGINNPYPGKMLLNKKILFSAHLYFKDGVLTADSQKALNELKNIIEDRGLNRYYVSVIGHTASYEDGNHMVDLNAWSTFWQNIGKRNTTQSAIAAEINSRIKTVYDHLLEVEHVSAQKVYTENRLAKDPISTEATDEGRARNQRVDVTLYE